MRSLGSSFPTFGAALSALLVCLAPLGCSSAADASPTEDAGNGSDAAHDSGTADAPRADTNPPPPPSYDGGPIAAAMNDVSILFPLPRDEADIDNLLSASSSGPLGTLLPSKLYRGVGLISGSSFVDGGNGPEAAYEDLHVVAMRLDPCFASLAPDPHGAGCAAQLRLVFQQVRDDEDAGASAFDSALHVFYSLDRAQLLALASALVDLRTANAAGVTLGPLAPHPIMVKQGLGGPFATGVRALVLQYAGEKNLTRVAETQLLLSEGPAAWTLAAFDVADATTATISPATIPTLLEGDGGVTSQGMALPFPPAPPSFECGIGPATTSTDDLTPLVDGKAADLSTAARQAAFDSLVRIENPGDNSPNTIDCASCHVATPTEQLVARPLFMLDDRTSPLAFQPDGKSVLAADMTPTYGQAVAGELNIHAFSYLGQSPGINQRVVNETAAIVQYLNDLPR